MSEQKKIVITGANGFIGSAVTMHFRDKGWSVIALVNTLPEKPLQEVLYDMYDLAGTAEEGAFENAYALVHCAYIKNDYEKNVSGTQRLLEVSRKHDLKKNIFISSFSAHPGAVSKYGKQKLEIENFFDTERDCVLRVGVVLGSGGGLFGQMKEHVLKGKRIPLIGGGKQPLQIIDVNDLVTVIDKVITENISGLYTLARPEAVAYRDFFAALGKHFNKKVRFIPLPFFLVNGALAVAEFFKLKLPVNRENVLGLKFIRERETKKDIEKLGVKLKSFEEALENL